MSLVHEHAKEILLEAIKASKIAPLQKENGESLSDYNKRTAEVIGECYKILVKKVDESFES